MLDSGLVPVLEVSEKEKGVVALYLPTGSLKTRSVHHFGVSDADIFVNKYVFSPLLNNKTAKIITHNLEFNTIWEH